MNEMAAVLKLSVVNCVVMLGGETLSFLVMRAERLEGNPHVMNKWFYLFISFRWSRDP